MVCPGDITEESCCIDRWAVGQLATHIISRTVDQSNNIPQKMLTIRCTGKMINIRFMPIEDFMDFLESRFEKDDDLQSSLKAGKTLWIYKVQC